MRYLVSRGPDGSGVIGSARTLREARGMAEEVVRRVRELRGGGGLAEAHIIDTRTGRVRPVRGTNTRRNA
jgi:hypothetical protein